MSKIATFLKRLIGRLKKMVSLITALCTILIPSAFILWLYEPSSPARYWGGWVCLILGVFSFIYGWVTVVRKEKQEHEESELRIRREKSTIILLTHMAEAQGVDMPKIIKTMEDKLGGE